MIRNLAKLSGTALIADAFILIGREYGDDRVTSATLADMDSHLHWLL